MTTREALFVTTLAVAAALGPGLVAQVQTEAPPAVPGAKPVTVERIKIHGEGTAAAQPMAAGIDATRTAQPITKLVFGGFMEPATTRVWAEMLYDRKFFNEINSKTQPAAPSDGGEFTAAGAAKDHAASDQHQRV